MTRRSIVRAGGLAAIYVVIAWLTGPMNSPHEHAIENAAALGSADTHQIQVREASTLFTGLFTLHRAHLHTTAPSGPHDSYIAQVHTPLTGWMVTRFEADTSRPRAH